MKVSHAFVFALFLLSSACGTKRVDICESDAECTNPAYPFCDVSGQYPASAGETNVCTIVPANCPAERCGCTPNAATCSDATLSVCNADGKSTTDTACDLGCSPDATRCATFAPSNGLADALGMAALENDVDLENVVIDNAGNINPFPSGPAITVRSIVVQQVGVAPIRVYLARSFKMAGVTLVPASSNPSPIAFVASGAITISSVDAGSPFGQLRVLGPGGQSSTAPCAGGSGNPAGGAGGGNATNGGDGAPTATIPPLAGNSGGPAQPSSFEPLVGGCPGGASTGGGSDGGAGGAGLQFVSRSSITVAAGGFLNFGGEGGADAAGGGAGGNVLFESPTVVIDGVVSANGGSGGACGMSGNNGPTNASAAASVGCTMPKSGSGGTATALPGVAVATFNMGGGGGGAVGRLGVNTSDGTFQLGTAAVVSAKTSMSALTPQ